jgi:hypothetical protein
MDPAGLVERGSKSFNAQSPGELRPLSCQRHEVESYWN